MINRLVRAREIKRSTPTFRREIGESIANAIPVLLEMRVIIAKAPICCATVVIGATARADFLTISSDGPIHGHVTSDNNRQQSCRDRVARNWKFYQLFG